MDKQIEEMVLAVYPWLKGVPIEERKQLSENVSGLMVMERLYNAGYRKIPENAVVLTGTAKEEHFVDLLTEFDEMGFYPLTTGANAEEYTKEWKRRMLYAIGQLRKETAEKFAEKLKEKAWAFNTDENGNVWDYSIMKSTIDEISKEITRGNV